MERTLQIIGAAVIALIAVGILLAFLFNALYGPDSSAYANASAGLGDDRAQEILRQGCDQTMCRATDANSTDCRAPACVRGRCANDALLLPAGTLCAGGIGRCDSNGTCA